MHATWMIYQMNVQFRVPKLVWAAYRGVGQDGDLAKSAFPDSRRREPLRAHDGQG